MMGRMRHEATVFALAILTGCSELPVPVINPLTALPMPLQSYAPHSRRTLLASDETLADDWNLRQINVGGYRLHASGVIGSRTVVAVLDTGIDPAQPTIAGHSYDALDIVGRDVYNARRQMVDYTGRDGNGHGTHVAGLVATVSTGFNVKVLPIKVIPNSGVGDDIRLTEGIYRALAWRDPADPAIRVRVLNLSVSSPRRSQRLEDAIKQAYASGVLVVGAAGNESLGVDFPADLPEVLSVGATTIADEVADYSCFGPALDVAAPGGSDDMPIYSTWPSYLTTTDYSGDVDEVHLRAGLVGTSMAAPHVAAVAGVGWSVFPNLSLQQIRALLLAMADDRGAPGPDAYFGFGRINFARVLGATADDAH